MTSIVGFSALTTTSATINLTGYGADGTIDVQLSPRSDFQFCVCPTYNFARGAALALPGLNQRSTYWARARNRAASGAVEDWSAAEAFRTIDGAAQYIQPNGILMEPALIVIPEKVIQSTSINAIPGFPLDNLFIDSPVAYRALETDTVNYPGLFQFYIRTAGQPVDTFALLNSNIPEAATCNIIGGPTANAVNYVGGEVPTFDTGQLAFRASPNLPQRNGYHGLFAIGGVRQCLWYRVLIQHASLPGKMLHLEHLVFGLNLASKNIANEKSETPAPLTSIERKRSGIPDRVLGRPMRKVDFDLDALTEAQYETLYATLWHRENGTVLALPNSKFNDFRHDRLLFGDLSGGKIINTTSPRFSRSFSVNSLI